jgi:hypothetical protein
MPRSASSYDSDSENPSIAHFDAQYIDAMAAPNTPAPELMLMIVPAWFSTKMWKNDTDHIHRTEDVDIELPLNGLP